MEQQPSAGWYDNPEGKGERYWDGAAWTDDYRQPQPDGTPWWKTPAIIIGAILAIAVVFALAGDGTEAPSDRPGDRAVYQRIETMTDCNGLQNEFDAALNRAAAMEPGSDARAEARSYAEAADDRMREVGCYD